MNEKAHCRDNALQWAVGQFEWSMQAQTRCRPWNWISVATSAEDIFQQLLWEGNILVCNNCSRDAQIPVGPGTLSLVCIQANPEPFLCNSGENLVFWVALITKQWGYQVPKVRLCHVAKRVCGDLRAHFANLFPDSATRIVCFHITFDRPVFWPSSLSLVNNNVACIHAAAAGDMLDVSPLLFPEQRARLIIGSVLLSVWRFAYFPLAQRAPHQLISTWQPQKSKSLGKCHF